MQTRHLVIMAAGTLALGACAHTGKAPIASSRPLGLGAIAGTVAADHDGDGVVDGYYTSEGLYHPFVAPPCPTPPPPRPSRRGERG